MRKPLPPNVFKSVPESEQQDWRDWARDNYSPGNPINPCWHPLVRAECEVINVEAWEKLEAPSRYRKPKDKKDIA